MNYDLLSALRKIKSNAELLGAVTKTLIADDPKDPRKIDKYLREAGQYIKWQCNGLYLALNAAAPAVTHDINEMASRCQQVDTGLVTLHIRDDLIAVHTPLVGTLRGSRMTSPIDAMIAHAFGQIEPRDYDFAGRIRLYILSAYPRLYDHLMADGDNINKAIGDVISAITHIEDNALYTHRHTYADDSGDVEAGSYVIVTPQAGPVMDVPALKALIQGIFDNI